MCFLCNQGGGTGIGSSYGFAGKCRKALPVFSRIAGKHCRSVSGDRKEAMSKELMEKYRHLIENNPYAILSHIHFEDIEPDGSKSYMDVVKEITNVYGLVHGGAYFTLADTTCGITVRADGHRYVTLNADANYLSTTEEKRVFCESRVLRHGRTTAVLEATVTDSTGRKLFYGVYTFYCLDPEKKKG